MSRPKSPERLALERDRAIRKERQERKHKEREARRAIRLRKKATHESVAKNGVPKVKPGDSHFGIRDAIAYSPLALCVGCGEAIRADSLIGNLCPQCKFGKEVVDASECLKASALEAGQVGRPSAQKERKSA
jgi:hypothetical protein